MRITLNIDDIISFGIRNDGQPIIIRASTKKVLLPQLGDYYQVKNDCLETGLFSDASIRYAKFYKEAFVKKAN